MIDSNDSTSLTLPNFEHIKLKNAKLSDLKLLYEITQISVAHINTESLTKQEYSPEKKKSIITNT